LYQMDILEAQKLIVKEAGALMGSLVASGPIVRRGETLRDIGRRFQALAICKLLVNADVGAFLEHLIRSGQARRYYLRKSHEEGNTNDRFLGLSRAEAILDVIVAGDVSLARDIVALSIDRWRDGWEYEDDFCYYLFIHGIVRDAAFVDSLEAMRVLRQFEQALDGQAAARLKLCESLRARDQEQFEAGFNSLISDYAEATDAKRVKFTEYTSDASAWPGCFVSIEALAWIAIGRTCGMALHGQFRFCPSEALGPFTPPTVEDLFQSLDQALR
jgi:hypothetical protein